MFSGCVAQLQSVNPHMRTRWMEVLLVVAIALAVAAPVLRFIYGRSWRQSERELFERFGINPELVWMLCAGFALLYLCFRRRDRGR